MFTVSLLRSYRRKSVWHVSDQPFNPHCPADILLTVQHPNLLTLLPKFRFTDRPFISWVNCHNLMRSEHLCRPLYKLVQTTAKSLALDSPTSSYRPHSKSATTWSAISSFWLPATSPKSTLIAYIVHTASISTTSPCQVRQPFCYSPNYRPSSQEDA